MSRQAAESILIGVKINLAERAPNDQWGWVVVVWGHAFNGMCGRARVGLSGRPRGIDRGRSSSLLRCTCSHGAEVGQQSLARSKGEGRVVQMERLGRRGLGVRVCMYAYM